MFKPNPVYGTTVQQISQKAELICMDRNVFVNDFCKHQNYKEIFMQAANDKILEYCKAVNLKQKVILEFSKNTSYSLM